MRKKGDSPHIDRERRRALIRGAVLRPTLTVIAFGCAYFFLPWIDVHTASAIFLLIGGGAAVLAVTTWQVWRILRSDVPSLQAVEAVAVVMPTYLLLVSITYFSVEHASPGSFTEPLSRMAALYFSLSVFSTVGFGDIAAQTDPCPGAREPSDRLQSGVDRIRRSIRRCRSVVGESAPLAFERT